MSHIHNGMPEWPDMFSQDVSHFTFFGCSMHNA